MSEDIKIYHPKDLTLKEILPGAKMWAIGMENSMLTYFDIAPDSDFPEHSHESEQITLVLDGELCFSYGGKTVTLKKGDAVAIPSNVPHRAVTAEKPCRAVDAWSPIRKDYLQK